MRCMHSKWVVNEKEDIKVKLLGGELSIKWDENVYMTGKARTVFEGEFNENVRAIN